MKRSWILICFINFFIASLMGLCLRWMYVSPMEGINFQYLMHGHSHVAMLGWVYLMLYCLIFYFFVPKEKQQKPIYNRLFWVTQLAVVGMMVDFPAQGYAFVSILFSTLHIFCSYFFCYLIKKDGCTSTFAEKKMLHTALFFMIFSTLGVWCLGPAVSLLGKASPFYQIAIQFFLHFQFNGWFLFAIIALFFKQAKLSFAAEKFRLFYNLFVVSTLLTLALPVRWYLPNPVFYWLNSLGLVLQLYAVLLFIQFIRPQFQFFFAGLPTVTKTVYGFALFSLFLKIIIQLVVLVPEFLQVPHQIRNFVIGYIHLTMLGIITGFLFGFALQNDFLNPRSHIQKLGIVIFLVGFVATEILLFLQGIWFFFGKGALPNYYQNLFLSSIFLPAGLLLLSIEILKRKQKPI